jgi:hypothetical protein
MSPLTTTRPEQSSSRQQPSNADYPTSSLTNGALSSNNSSYPSLQHPSIVPLQLQGRSVELRPSGSKLVKELNSSFTLNESASKHGALVFGVSTTEGPTSMFNVSIGKVS